MIEDNEADNHDRRSNDELRQFIATFDEIAQRSTLITEWAGYFFEAADRLNDYETAVLAIAEKDNPAQHEVVATYSRNPPAQTLALPIYIEAPSLEEIYHASHRRSFVKLVPQLILEVDFSILGWSKPRHLDIYPLRYEGHYLGVLLFVPNASVEGSVHRQARLQVLLQRFTKQLAWHLTPELLHSTAIPAFTCQDDLQIEAFISSPVPIVLTNEYFKIRAINSVAEAFFDAPTAEVEGRPLAEMLPQAYESQHLNILQGSKKDDVQYDMSFTTRKGNKKNASVNFRYIRWSKNAYWWVTIVDITQLRQYQSLHQQQSNRLRAISDVMPTGLLQTNDDWEVTYANEMWCELTETAREELQGLNWLQFILPEDIESFVLELKYHIQRNHVFDTRVRSSLMRDGSCAWFNVKVKSLPGNEGLMVCLEDITDYIQQADKLLTMASTDELTQLVNRPFFFDRLSSACQQASRHSGFSLLSVDLDNFKWVNDSLGHHVGDAALKLVANHLLNCVRETDSVARIGGDEFMVLLPDCSDPHQAMRIAEEIIAGNQELARFAIEVSFSVGIVVVDNHQNPEMNQLLKQADLALYSAKSAGKRQACFYSTELSETFEKQVALTHELRLGLRRKQFKLVFQLIWNSKKRCFIGAEALLRWQRSKNELAAPDEFIERLENDGGIAEVSFFVIDQALASLKDWIDRGLLPLGSHVAVNFSPKLFRIKNLCEEITSRLQKYDLSSSALMIEITESTLFHDEGSAQQTISKLQQLGIKIALDDFGTGYSPLAYLTKLTIDCIKIDKSFVLDIHSDKNQTIIKAITLLANELDLALVAEGVETEQAFQFLEQLNCGYYQGYLFHKPAYAEQIVALLEELKLQKDAHPHSQMTASIEYTKRQ